MSVTLVDTNVLLDLVTNDARWADWSVAQLDAAVLRGPILINDVIYAELSVRFTTIEALDTIIGEIGVDIAEIPRSALFLAGKAFQRYRLAGGARTSVLPDFFIGAHAAVMGFRLLSRDAQRYRAYFPTIDLVTP